MAGPYAALHSRSLADPEGFWAEAASAVTWTKPWDRVLDDTNAPLYRWFTGGELNTSYNCLDRHVEAGNGERTALIYDSPVTNTKTIWSYQALRDRVARIAGMLRGLGVGKGDRVLIYMPMIPETMMAMLAVARLGAIHSVVFGGFAANELKVRIDDAQPKVILAGSCGIEVQRIVPYKPLLDHAIELATHKPDSVVLWQRPQAQGSLVEGRDYDWAALEAAASAVDCVPVAATDPLYILYTSGTTGIPKGVVRDTGGHLVALTWSMRAIYDIGPGDVMFTASDLGWVVGHSYICYAPLAVGGTTILYEGKPVGTPDAGAFWRVIAEYGVKVMFTAPTAFRAIKKEDPEAALVKQYDLSRFKALFLAGERCDPDTLRWAERILGVPVVDHWWQTETGWPICANPLGIEQLPVKAGSPTVAMAGWNVQVLDAELKPAAAGEIGSLVVKLPLPPGALPTLWQNEDGFRRSYLNDFPGYYKTADAGIVDEDGYVFVMSRTDDIINVAGHRLSTGGMEEVLASHPDVAECAVIGVADALKGQVPLGFVVLKAGVTRSEDDIVKEIVQLVRDRIGPVAAFKTATVVKRLPKTRSGKILRGTMQKIADGEQWKMPATIDDPVILDEITGNLKEIGYAKP
ncbi:MAG: propionyl-CoA synthetase [Alphaproteobacteria bacterium]|nr:propionyl-CoA synthetase [Alphaproteobacteria bacterium]